MTLGHRQQNFAGNVAKLLYYIYNKGYTVTLGEALRTQEMAEIYAKRGTGIKNSQHCKKLAIDLNLFKDGVFLTSSEAHRPFGDYWETLNPDNRWGGMWNDGNHYEMKG